jgi:E3 ubiquitin-protein ligase RNF14
MAIEAARQADAEEAEAAAMQIQAQEDERAAQLIFPPAPQPPRHAQEVPLNVAMQQMGLGQHPAREEQHAVPRAGRGNRRPRNPFPARPPANGAGQAVRNHERQGARPVPVVNDGRNALEDRQQELQRFLELARNDQEHDWDSDELGDDEEFIIREHPQ